MEALDKVRNSCGGGGGHVQHARLQGWWQFCPVLAKTGVSTGSRFWWRFSPPLQWNRFQREGKFRVEAMRCIVELCMCCCRTQSGKNWLLALPRDSDTRPNNLLWKTQKECEGLPGVATRIHGNCDGRGRPSRQRGREREGNRKKSWPFRAESLDWSVGTQSASENI